METLEAIRTRRTIRRFTEKDMSEDLIRTILEAGTFAPSSKNTQPWHFMILKDTVKEDVVNIVEKKFYTNERSKDIKSSHLNTLRIIRSAPLFIIVFNKGPYTGGEDKVIGNCNLDSLQHWTIEVQGVSAAIQNMLLAAHDLGLAGVWIADINFARKEICKYLNCKYDLIAGVAIGYPAYTLSRPEIQKCDIEA